jgi:hypothetical protein
MLSWSALSAFMVLQLLGLPRSLAATASAAVAPTPVPLTIPPSGSWYVPCCLRYFPNSNPTLQHALTGHLTHRDGNDGPWSSFSLRVGTPPQNLRVLVSTASNQPWGVLPEGCQSSDPSDCPNDRGTIFQPNASSSYYVPSW